MREPEPEGVRDGDRDEDRRGVSSLVHHCWLWYLFRSLRRVLGRPRNFYTYNKIFGKL